MIEILNNLSMIVGNFATTFERLMGFSYFQDYYGIISKYPWLIQR